jgi:hypothetical protein
MDGWMDGWMERHDKINEICVSLQNVSESCVSSIEVQYMQGPFAKFIDSPYYSKLEVCGGVVVVVSFLEYLP